MSVAKIIEDKLRINLDINSLEVIDDSHKHAGHAGAPHGGESHFTIHAEASDFNNKSRIEKQRMVYKILSEELKHQIHALSLDLNGTE